jgi:amino acid permease
MSLYTTEPVVASFQMNDASTRLLDSLNTSDSFQESPTTAAKGTVGKILHQASLLACTAAMANTILGAGMLGLPHAMAESGYVLGCFLLVSAACASAFALHLLSVSSMKVAVEPSSFYVVASRAVPKAAWLIDLAVAIKCFGVATSYLIVIGDLVPDAIGTLIGHGHADFVYTRRFWILIYAVCIVIPLSCLRSLNALRFTATLSMVFVSFLAGVITLYAMIPSLDECAGMADLDKCRQPTRFFKLDVGTLKIFSIFIFGFTCHQNIFSACNELKDLTVSRINTVIVGCIGIALTVYSLIALCAYSTYGAAIQSDVLNNYPDNVVLAIARVLIATNCSFTFPLQCNPCRTSISMLMHQWKHRKQEPETVEAHVPSEMRLTILTALITMCSFAVAMVVKDLGIILAVVGATGSTTMSYILPGIIYLKLHQDVEKWTPKHYGAAALLGAGCVIIPACLIFIGLGGGGH